MFMVKNSNTLRGFSSFDSPLGEIAIFIENNKIVEVHLEGDRDFSAVTDGWTRDPDAPLLRQARKQFAEYFAGMRKEFDLPLAMHGTDFQRRVWAALTRIPSGQARTYQDVANEIGEPLAVRAVGAAIGRNPICIIVPCHRVVSSSGSLGGYRSGIERKQQLLALEGAQTRGL